MNWDEKYAGCLLERDKLKAELATLRAHMIGSKVSAKTQSAQLEHPQYVGLRQIICSDWDYALHLSITPRRTWKEIQYKLMGMADYAAMLNHNDTVSEELRKLSDLALEHRLNGFNKRENKP